MRTLLAIDFDRWAADTYRANFPDVRVECGRVEDSINELPPVDIIVGGPPCQGFSTAGKGAGKNDDRNGWPAFIEAVRRVKPRQFLAENVPGMMTAKHMPYLQSVVSELVACGYSVGIKKLDAVNFGAPQFRKRVWIWGIRRDVYDGGARHCWPTPTHQWPWPDGCMFGGSLLPAVTCGWTLNIPHMQKDGVWFEGDGPHKNEPLMISGSKGRRSHDGTHLRGPLIDGVGRPSWTIDAAPPSIAEGAGPKHEYRVIGGGRNHPDKNPDGTWRRDERDITQEPSTTIPGSGFALHGGVIPRLHEYRHSAAMLTKHPPASPASPASTVQAKWFKGGAEGLVMVEYDPKHPCNQVDRPGVTPRSGGRGHTAPGGPDTITDGIFVRRLSPLECARLQSCPDDMRWPAKITKTAMYRIIGNGWNCAMAAKMGEALRQADPGSQTLIDLFCGGGLGAMGLHGRYWSWGGKR